MNRLLSGAVKVAGALAVAGGAVLASALPAGAVTLPRSWGAQATGIVTLPQVALSTPGITPVTAFNVSAGGLFSASFILDRSGPDTSYSKVQNAGRVRVSRRWPRSAPPTRSACAPRA